MSWKWEPDEQKKSLYIYADVKVMQFIGIVSFTQFIGVDEYSNVYICYAAHEQKRIKQPKRSQENKQLFWNSVYTVPFPSSLTCK